MGPATAAVVAERKVKFDGMVKEKEVLSAKLQARTEELRAAEGNWKKLYETRKGDLKTVCEARDGERRASVVTLEKLKTANEVELVAWEAEKEAMRVASVQLGEELDIAYAHVATLDKRILKQGEHVIELEKTVALVTLQTEAEAATVVAVVPRDQPSVSLGLNPPRLLTVKTAVAMLMLLVTGVVLSGITARRVCSRSGGGVRSGSSNAEFWSAVPPSKWTLQTELSKLDF
jgi:hypothetical protein